MTVIGKADVTVAGKKVTQFECASLQKTRETNTSSTREDDVVQKIHNNNFLQNLVQWFMEAGGKVHFTPAHTHTHPM